MKRKLKTAEENDEIVESEAKTKKVKNEEHGEKYFKLIVSVILKLNPVFRNWRGTRTRQR